MSNVPLLAKRRIATITILDQSNIQSYLFLLFNSDNKTERTEKKLSLAHSLNGHITHCFCMKAISGERQNIPGKIHTVS